MIVQNDNLGKRVDEFSKEGCILHCSQITRRQIILLVLKKIREVC